jgi:hypothetical protein
MTIQYPDVDNTMGELLAVTSRAASEDDPLEVTGGAWFRHSNAGSCSRAIAYAMAGVEPTDPPDTTSHHSFKVGHLVHEAWQAALLGIDETALIEPTYVIPDGDAERPLTGCHIDAVVFDGDGTAIVVEVKTANEYGYSDAILKAQGPKWSHVVQASLNAKAFALDSPGLEVRARIVYLPMTSVSTGRASKKGIADTNRHGAQWTLDRAQWEPIADWELARVEWIKGLVTQPDRDAEANARRVPRWYPGDRQVEAGEPMKILDRPEHTTWPCGYCPYFSQCVKDGG